jgi:hypothetical protein
MLTVADPTGAQSEHRAMAAYTISQPWPLAAQRPGVISIALDRARALGHQRPFVLHLGRASGALKRELVAKLKDVLTRHRDSRDVLGPDRPRPRR